jgi:poly-gamma-glutamate synthesis protein (capsule biosynthesis protein)
MHMPLLQAAHRPEQSTYDFKPMFYEVEKHLAGADFTLANLETRLAGPERGYSGYPRFNTPAELAVDMKAIGIDMVTTANNHCMDMGETGVFTTLDNLDRAGLLHIGTYRSQKDREQTFTVNIKGIRLGFLNYTQSTNGIPIPASSPYLANTIERAQIIKDIELLKLKKPDLIIACIHFGTEYQQEPNEFQRTLTRELFEQGVDAVLGCHVHVLQPMEKQKISVGGKEKECFVIYSLGNFISNQRWRYSDCGAIMNLDITKTPSEEVQITSASYIPVWVHTYRKDNRLSYRVLPVNEAIENYQSGKDNLLSEKDYQRLLQVKQDVNAVLGSAINFYH